MGVSDAYTERRIREQARRSNVTQPQTPVLQALILADQVYRDERTHKCVIAGTFNQLFAPKFPSALNRVTYAYLKLTEVVGQHEIVIRYVDLRTNEVLLQSEPSEVSCDDPLMIVEMIIEVPPFPMPREGVYAFEVYAADALLGASRITVGVVERGKTR